MKSRLYGGCPLWLAGRFVLLMPVAGSHCLSLTLFVPEACRDWKTFVIPVDATLCVLISLLLFLTIVMRGAVLHVPCGTG